MKNRCLNYNKLIILLFTIFSGLFYSQNYENPDNWFLGMDYTDAISGVELKAGNESYTFTLESWLKTLYDSEDYRREIWLKLGGFKPSEPEEVVLLENDFTISSDKLQRIKIRAKDEVSSYKIALQKFLLSTYKFDMKNVYFDKNGNLSHVLLIKFLGNEINTHQEILNFDLMKQILTKIYGESKNLKKDKIGGYFWNSYKFSVYLLANLEDKCFSVSYLRNESK